MKKKYFPASLELIAFEGTDVIATSSKTDPPGWGGNVDGEHGWT